MRHKLIYIELDQPNLIKNKNKNKIKLFQKTPDHNRT